ncbi:tyrosine-protein phosphatase non-receptor type 13-like [Watersipora subatra]|uniref:tyrosine-protein phosphatase non-receptor type 13-like n=1 Tax=Watersipora subatra TaxID=2589382 RepID=UPI00355C5938
MSEEDFSSVEGDVPDDIEDTWSSDTESEAELVQGVIPDSHINTPSQSDLNSTLERTIESDHLPESRINTPSQESSSGEEEGGDAVQDLPEAQSPHDRPQSNTSLKESLSSWGDSVVMSDEEDSSGIPIDLTRGDSQRTVTDAASSSPIGGLSRNTSTHLSRHDSTHSNQSFLSTPVLSRNTSLKLPPTEEVYAVTLNKPNEKASLGFSVLGIQAGGNVYACVKSVSRGGIAHADGRISVGDRILQINGEEVAADTEAEIQALCAGLLKQCHREVNLILAADKTDSYSEDLALTQEEGLLHSDDQLGALSDGPYEMKLVGRTAPRRIFGPSVTTTDEDSEYDGGDDLSAAIQHLGDEINRSGTPLSQPSSDSLTDESSFDFDLPDESQYLEASIRLTRRDMRSPLSNVKHSSESDTDHVMSDENMHSTRFAPDDRTDNTDVEESTYVDQPPEEKALNYDGGAIPGSLAEQTEAIEKRLRRLTLPAHLYNDKSNRLSNAAGVRSQSWVPQRSPSKDLQPMAVYKKLLIDPASSESVDIQSDSEKVEEETLEGPFAIEISMEWVEGLELINTPLHGLYTNNYLEGVIADLLTKIASDDTSEEFKELKSIKPTDYCETGKLKDNKSKNRFRNVLPYDLTRVKLNNEDDYINASHVQRTFGSDLYHYIASQGPMPHTADDFWEMVLEQDISVIAMVTQDVEGGKVKCHRYWPDSLYTPMNIYEVTLTKLFSLDDFDVRHLEVRDVETNETKKVIHMNYTKWPDHGMPNSATPLLQFMRVMHKLHTTGPILVHCSAGIGRTGTLITLDMVIGSIERDLKFDINEIVTYLRKQRPGMIQTKDQYLFCYTATLQILETLRKSSPAQGLQLLEKTSSNFSASAPVNRDGQQETIAESIPATASSTRTPASAFDTGIPATASNIRTPATASDTGIPSTVSNTRTPATSSDTGIPATASNTKTPASASDTGIPTTVSNTRTPATASDTSIPANSSDTRTPATASDTKVNSSAVSETSKEASVTEIAKDDDFHLKKASEPQTPSVTTMESGQIPEPANQPSLGNITSKVSLSHSHNGPVV